MKMKFAFLLLFLLCAFHAVGSARTISSELILRGYTVLPAPQRVRLEAGDIEFNGSWTYEAKGIDENHIALRSLLRDLKDIRPRSAFCVRARLSDDALARQTQATSNYD